MCGWCCTSSVPPTFYLLSRLSGKASNLYLYHKSVTNTSCSRVLLASIRNLGACPCPRCEVKKVQIEQLGTIPDNQRRSNHMRSNTTSLRNRIALCREAIYGRGKNIKSSIVEDFLSPLSYVPTSVWKFINMCVAYMLMDLFFLECLC